MACLPYPGVSDVRLTNKQHRPGAITSGWHLENLGLLCKLASDWSLRLEHCPRSDNLVCMPDGSHSVLSELLILASMWLC